MSRPFFDSGGGGCCSQNLFSHEKGKRIWNKNGIGISVQCAQSVQLFSKSWENQKNFALQIVFLFLNNKQKIFT